MIKTKKFQLTKNEYFMFLIRLELKRRGLLFALMLMFSIAILFTGKKDSLTVFIIVVGFLYPLTIFKYWSFANSKENKIIFKERQHEIFHDRIISQMGEISNSTIPVENFIKVFELKDLYLLYIMKGQCLFLPKRIFETPEDENWFRNEVFLKIKNR